MNYFKVQQDVMKAFEKSMYGKSCTRYQYYQTDEDTYITDGYAIWIIPNKMFALDVNKVFSCTPSSFEKLTKDIEGECINTHQTFTSQGKTYQVFKHNDANVYVDVKLLKYFDIEYSTFKVNSTKSPVAIYEGDKMVGIVMPTYIKEG